MGMMMREILERIRKMQNRLFTAGREPCLAKEILSIMTEGFEEIERRLDGVEKERMRKDDECAIGDQN